jgi:large subunit ribosomal protein L16
MHTKKNQTNQKSQKNQKNFIKKKTGNMKTRIKKIKYKRVHKGRTALITHSSRTGNLRFGKYGILILKPTWFDEKKIEAGRKYIRKFLSKKEHLWIRIFPDIPVTKKPTGIRMGKGKGKPHIWVSKVTAGSIIYEIDNISEKKIKQINNILKKAWTQSFQLIAADF